MLRLHLFALAEMASGGCAQGGGATSVGQRHPERATCATPTTAAQVRRAQTRTSRARRPPEDVPPMPREDGGAIPRAANERSTAAIGAPRSDDVLGSDGIVYAPERRAPRTMTSLYARFASTWAELRSRSAGCFCSSPQCLRSRAARLVLLRRLRRRRAATAAPSNGATATRRRRGALGRGGCRASHRRAAWQNHGKRCTCAPPRASRPRRAPKARGGRRQRRAERTRRSA